MRLSLIQLALLLCAAAAAVRRAAALSCWQVGPGAGGAYTGDMSSCDAESTHCVKYNMTVSNSMGTYWSCGKDTTCTDQAASYTACTVCNSGDGCNSNGLEDQIRCSAVVSFDGVDSALANEGGKVLCADDAGYCQVTRSPCKTDVTYGCEGTSEDGFVLTRSCGSASSCANALTEPTGLVRCCALSGTATTCDADEGALGNQRIATGNLDILSSSGAATLVSAVQVRAWWTWLGVAIVVAMRYI